MEYRGRVRDGVIVLDGGVALREGAEVRVQTVSEVIAGATEQNGETVGQKLLRFAGKAQGLPPDAARNHDHYLYGSPKR